MVHAADLAFTYHQTPGAVAKSVEREPRVREIGSSVPSQVKSMTYKIDTCHFLAWRFELIDREITG